MSVPRYIVWVNDRQFYHCELLASALDWKVKTGGEIYEPLGMTIAEKVNRPKIVCLCGSTRFYEAFQKANYELTKKGCIVLSVGHYPHSPQQAHGEHIGCTPEEKIALDQLHFRKIELADEILVLNVHSIVCGRCGKPAKLFTELSQETECCRAKHWTRENYIGESTRNEINYATKIGKPVRYLNPLE